MLKLPCTVNIFQLLGAIETSIGKDATSCVANLGDEKELLLFMGNTGAGKTTTILFATGHQMICKKDKIIVEIEGSPMEMETECIDCAKSVSNFTIGHSGTSETLRATVTLASPSLPQAKDLVFCDTRGFADTSGNIIGIANMVAIKTLIGVCKKLKPVLVIPWNAFYLERGVRVKELISLLSRIFVDSSIWEKRMFIFVTKAEGSKANLAAQVNKLKMYFNSRFSETLEISDKKNELIFTQILKGLLFNTVHIVKPLEDNPEEVVDMLATISPIENPSSCCNFALSGDAIRELQHMCSEFKIASQKWANDKQFDLIVKYIKAFHELSQYIETLFPLKDTITSVLHNIKGFVVSVKRMTKERFSNALKTSDNIATSVIEQLQDYELLVMATEELRQIYFAEDNDMEAVNELHSWLISCLQKACTNENVLISDQTNTEDTSGTHDLAKVNVLLNKLIIVRDNFESCAELLNVYSTATTFVRNYLHKLFDSSAITNKDWHNNTNHIVEILEQLKLATMLQDHFKEMDFAKMYDNFCELVRDNLLSSVEEAANVVADNNFWGAVGKPSDQDQEKCNEQLQKLTSAFDKINTVTAVPLLASVCGEELIGETKQNLLAEILQILEKKVDKIKQKAKLAATMKVNMDVLNSFKFLMTQVQCVSSLDAHIFSRIKPKLQSTSTDLSVLLMAVITNLDNSLDGSKVNADEAAFCFQLLKGSLWLDEMLDNRIAHLQLGIATKKVTTKLASLSRSCKVFLDSNRVESFSHAYVDLIKLQPLVGDMEQVKEYIEPVNCKLKALTTIFKSKVVDLMSSKKMTLRQADRYLSELASFKQLENDLLLLDKVLPVSFNVTQLHQNCKFYISNDFTSKKNICAKPLNVNDEQDNFEEKTSILDDLQNTYCAIDEVQIKNSYAICVGSILQDIKKIHCNINSAIDRGHVDTALQLLNMLATGATLQYHIKEVMEYIAIDKIKVLEAKARLSADITSAWEQKDISKLKILLAAKKNTSTTRVFGDTLRDIGIAIDRYYKRIINKVNMGHSLLVIHNVPRITIAPLYNEKNLFDIKNELDHICVKLVPILEDVVDFSSIKRHIATAVDNTGVDDVALLTTYFEKGNLSTATAGHKLLTKLTNILVLQRTSNGLKALEAKMNSCGSQQSTLDFTEVYSQYPTNATQMINIVNNQIQQYINSECKYFKICVDYADIDQAVKHYNNAKEVCSKLPQMIKVDPSKELLACVDSLLEQTMANLESAARTLALHQNLTQPDTVAKDFMVAVNLIAQFNCTNEAVLMDFKRVCNGLSAAVETVTDLYTKSKGAADGRNLARALNILHQLNGVIFQLQKLPVDKSDLVEVHRLHTAINNCCSYNNACEELRELVSKLEVDVKMALDNFK